MKQQQNPPKIREYKRSVKYKCVVCGNYALSAKGSNYAKAKVCHNHPERFIK